jgi:hypothetical protein
MNDNIFYLRVVMLDQNAANTLFKHVLEIWVIPEIEVRIRIGELNQQPYHLYAAQIVSFTDGRKNVIRLNDEVKTTIIGVARKTLQPNETFVLEDGISEIKKFELTHEDDPNAGHLTMMRFKNRWQIYFDFRYNKKMAKERLEAAEEFLNAAALDRERKLIRPMAENLFAAIELCITAQLLLQADKDYAKNQHHTGTKNRYVSFIDIGNYKTEYKDTFIELTNLRRSGRYLQKEFSLSLDKADRYLEIVKDIMAYTKELLI